MIDCFGSVVDPDPVETGTFLDSADPDSDQTFLTKNLI